MDKNPYGELDEVMEELNQFLNHKQATSAVKEDSPEAVEAAIAHCMDFLRKEMQAGRFSPKSFHELDVRVRDHRRRVGQKANDGQMAKALRTEVQRGAVSVIEAGQRASMMIDPAMRGLGEWWKSSYFQQA